MSYNNRNKNTFTLIELVAVLALLAVISIFLVRFYINVEKGYRQSLRLTSLSENARDVFSLLSSDLSAIVSRPNDIPGQDIKIHQPAPGSLWFISACPDDSGVSGLVEIRYRLIGETLERSLRCERDSDWEIYGDRKETEEKDSYQEVMDGILRFEFICYDKNRVIYTPTQATAPPQMIGIVMTFLPPTAYKRWLKLPLAQRYEFAKNNARSFRKTVDLQVSAIQSGS